MLRVDKTKIEILQARKGLSVGKLITISGLTEKTIQNMKHGKPCKPLSVHKLAKALGVDVTEIIKESEGANNE